MLDGIEIVTAPSPLDLTSSIRAIRTERVDVLMGTPTFLRGYFRKGKIEDLKSLRYVVAEPKRLLLLFVKSGKKKWVANIWKDTD